MRKLLRVNIEEITVTTNGDSLLDSPSTKKEKKSPKTDNNAIVATLVYPRPGAPTVVSTKTLNLRPRVEHRFVLKDFWNSGLFKEEVLDETILKIQITDRDGKSKLAQFFLKVFSTALGTGLGPAVSGISNVFLGAIATTGLAAQTKAMAGDGKAKIIVIGEASHKIDLRNPVKNQLTLQLKVPKAFKTVAITGGKRRVTTFKTGQQIGTIKLRLSTADL